MRYLVVVAMLAGGFFIPPHAGEAYDFTRLATTYAVPAELNELSGQTWVHKYQLACIEDESGNLYFYNLRTHRLDSAVSFAGPGDYEDVARVPGGWLILRSDGHLFKRSGRTTTSYDTGLSAANEPEGLAYYAASQSLLVACKGESGVGQSATQRAVHPRTHHVFVLLARGYDLVELDAQGHLVAAHILSPTLFPQPEGLAFAPNGDLFVSSEAGSKHGTGRLYRFTEQLPQPYS